MVSDDLERFVTAQNDIYASVVAELSAACKRSHWMWFIFPQIAGLGPSMIAQRYAIGSVQEARSYFAHDLLGPRLIECIRLYPCGPGSIDYGNSGPAR